MKKLLTLLLTLTLLLFTACNRLPDADNSDTSNIYSATQSESSKENDDPIIDHDEWTNHISVLGGIVKVCNERIDFSELSIKADASPNTNYARTVDAEDVIEITLGKQDSSFDINKLSIIGVAHQNMKNPYKTASTQFDSEFREIFTKNGDEFISQFSIGYKTNIVDAVELLFVYDGKIEAYVPVLMVFQHKTSVPYWRYMRPLENVQQFHIQCGESLLDYCYFEQNPTTVLSWHTQDCSLYDWELYEGWLVDKNRQWMISPEQYRETLTGDCTIIAEPFDESSFFPYEYDDENPNYAVYYLGADAQKVINKFHEPQSVRKFGDITIIQYPEFSFYLDNNTVVQIDIINGDTLLPINDFVTKHSTGAVIHDKCNALNIDYPDVLHSFDEQFSIYQYILPFKNNNWTVAYIWESNEPINTNITEFTQISIYIGDTILF